MRPYRNYCHVTIRPATRVHGINLPLASTREWWEAVDVLQLEFQRIGIGYDLESACISAIEVGQDVHVDLAPEAYIEMLSQSASPPWLQRHTGPGLFWRSGARSLTVYDKTTLLRQHGHDSLSPEGHLLRFETRIKTPRAARSHAAVGTLEQLRASGFGSAFMHHRRLLMAVVGACHA